MKTKTEQIVLMDKDELILLVIKYLKDSRQAEFQELLDELHSYDVADIYKSLPYKHHHKFVQMSTPAQIALLIRELDIEHQEDIIQKLGVEKSSEVMDLMENDDLADLLNELSVEKMHDYLDAMEEEESKTVQHLLHYPPETAGGIMTNRFVWIKNHYTVTEAVEKLRSFAAYAENIYYLYVLDQDKKLVGVVSYRDLLLAGSDERVEDIMYTRVISVPAEMDQEQVAQIIERYDFIAVPVVDENHRMIGIITVDDIIDVMITEANEDIEKLHASGSIDFHTSALKATGKRLPWLILLLFLGLLTGSIISRFETTIDQIVALTFFMPMISGMTGNTGTQSLAIIVRGLVSEDLSFRNAFRIVFREFRVGLMIGAVCGILVAVMAVIWRDNYYLALVVGLSLFLTLIIGTLAGTIIPLILQKLRVDPAIASGPLITTLNDIFSLMVYFGLATLFIQQLL